MAFFEVLPPQAVYFFNFVIDVQFLLRFVADHFKLDKQYAFVRSVIIGQVRPSLFFGAKTPSWLS